MAYAISPPSPPKELPSIISSSTGQAGRHNNRGPLTKDGDNTMIIDGLMLGLSSSLDNATTDTAAATAYPTAGSAAATATTMAAVSRSTDASNGTGNHIRGNVRRPGHVISAAVDRGRGSSENIRSRLLTRLGIYGANGNVTGGGTGGGGGSSSSSSNTMMMTTQPTTAAQQRRERILRGMGVGYTMFQQSPPDGSATRIPLSGLIPSKEPLKGIYSDDDDYDDESIVIDDEDDDDDGDDDNDDDRVRVQVRVGSSDDTGDEKDKRSKPKITRIAFDDQVEVMPIPTRHEYSNRIKSRIWSNRYELQENAERNAVEFASEGWNWRTVTEDEGMYVCSVSGELVHPCHVGGLPIIESNAPK